MQLLTCVTPVHCATRMAHCKVSACIKAISMAVTLVLDTVGSQADIHCLAIIICRHAQLPNLCAVRTSKDKFITKHLLEH